MVTSKDVDRLFLQAVISRRYFSQKMGKLLWQKCIKAVNEIDENLHIEYDNSKDAWSTYVAKLNDSMNALNLEIVLLHDETTGVPMHALVNRKGDDLAQVASDYSPQELAYFKALVDMIMTAPNNSYCISSLGALREISNLKINMTKTQGEVVLNSFVARGWLLKSSKGKYTLSTRTSLELVTYLRTTYTDDILDCTICLEMVTRGIRCHTCKVALHHHCYKNFTKSGKNCCPTCDKLWDDGDKKVKPIGEAAYREGQEQNRIRTRRLNDSEEEDEEEFDSDSQQAPTQTQRQTQTQAKKSKAKGKGKKPAKQEESIEVDEDGDSPPPQTQPKRKSRR